jgi:hypothetical protein
VRCKRKQNGTLDLFGVEALLEAVVEFLRLAPVTETLLGESATRQLLSFELESFYILISTH